MSRTLLRSLFSFDPRPTSEVEDEMRAEFDAHLAMLEDELAQQGLDPIAARDQALARFGDPTRLSREGKAIKLGDRIMLQRINLALLIVVGAAVIFLLVQNQRISNRSVATLEQVAANLAAIQQRQPAPQAVTPQGPPAKVVYISGLVERPGTYALPPGGMSLGRLVAAAGGIKAGAKTLYIDSERPGANGPMVWSTSMLDDLDHQRLDPNDSINVSADEDPRAPYNIQIDVRGYVARSGPRRIVEKTATLANLINSSDVEPQAARVRLERSGEFAREFSLAEALAATGRDVRLGAGDVITVLAAKDHIPAVADWKNYKPTDEITTMMASDQALLQLVEGRTQADKEAAQLLAAGVPIDHATLVDLRKAAERREQEIDSRALTLSVRKAADSDSQLKQLLDDLKATDDNIQEMRLRASRQYPGPNWQEVWAKREALQNQINARYNELTSK